MRRRTNPFLGWLLLAQALVLSAFALMAPLLFNGFGPPDDDWAAWDWAGREDAAHTARGALTVLAVVSAGSGVRRLLRRRSGWELLPWTHVGAGLAVAAGGSSTLEAVLVLAGCAWGLLLSGADRPRALPTDHLVSPGG